MQNARQMLNIHAKFRANQQTFTFREFAITSATNERTNKLAWSQYLLPMAFTYVGLRRNKNRFPRIVQGLLRDNSSSSRCFEPARVKHNLA